jgi:hypothetical protein
MPPNVLTLSPWPTLEEAIEYIAEESEVARREWTAETLGEERDGKRALVPLKRPPSPDLINELISTAAGASLYGRATIEIKRAAAAGKLLCRGIEVGTTMAVKIPAAGWSHLEITAEGEVARVSRVKRGRSGPLVEAWHSVCVDGRQLKRLFPRSSGRRGVRPAEGECGRWLAGLPSKPVRIKEDVRLDAVERWSDRLSGDAFDRAWKAHAPTEWKRKGRRPSSVGRKQT